jgi:Holliday junction resolvasome RuvABC endonuclease subunit
VRERGGPPISEAERVERLINLTNDIVGIAKDYKVRYAGVEGYAHNKRFQAHQIGEIAGNVKVQLWLAKKILVEPIPPQTGRKHFLGYGSVAKSTVFEILSKRLGLTVDNDHESDAYVVARYLWDFLAQRERKMRG